MTVDDLKPHPDDASPMTPERAFTIAQIIVYRLRDDGPRTETERAALTRAAELIAEVAGAWR